MRAIFEKQMEKLNLELMKMGALGECAIAAAIKSVFENSSVDAQKASTVEKEIDIKESEIETFCSSLLLRQQPVAADFRYITSALKMIADIERIGDQAADIAELSKVINGVHINGEIHLANMARCVAGMLTQSIESFVRLDEQMAYEVIKLDDDVDMLFVKVRSILIENISENALSGEVCMDYLMVAKYLERIGDHATNIAESVIYAISGVRVGEVK